MKKGYLLILLALLTAIIIHVVQLAIPAYQKKRLQKHYFEKYQFEIAYPSTFQEINVPQPEEEMKNSNISVSISGEDVADFMEDINLTENVLHLKDGKNAVKMDVDAINIQKASLSMEEICKRYIVMFRIYNEEADITEKETELIGENRGKVTFTVKGEKEDSKVVAYLYSFPKQEITLTFITTKSRFEKQEKLMDKIADSIKIVEKES